MRQGEKGFKSKDVCSGKGGVKRSEERGRRDRRRERDGGKRDKGDGRRRGGNIGLEVRERGRSRIWRGRRKGRRIMCKKGFTN